MADGGRMRGVPAEHVKGIDRDRVLPTPVERPDREWDGQLFVHDRSEGATWAPFRLPRLVAGDAFVIPPGLPTRLTPGAGLELVEVALPGRVRTELV